MTHDMHMTRDMHMTTLRLRLEHRPVIIAVSSTQYAICTCTNSYMFSEKHCCGDTLQCYSAVILCSDTLQ